MSDDFDVAELLDCFARIFTEAFESNSVAPVSASVLPAKPIEVPPPNPKYPEGAKYRVLENEWWDNVTTNDVLTVVYSTSLEVLFRHPRGGNLVVPMGMIDDFEKVGDDANNCIS